MERITIIYHGCSGYNRVRKNTISPSRRKVMKLAASSGASTLTISGLAAAEPDQKPEIKSASGRQIQRIVHTENFQSNKKKAKEHGESLKAGQTLAVKKPEEGVDAESFIVPIQGQKVDDVNSPSEVAGYHAIFTENGIESILYLGDEEFYGSVDNGNEYSTQISTGVNLPGFSKKKVLHDEVCNELQSYGEDVLCLGAVGYTTLLTLAKRAIPYIGGAVTALCAAKSETCSRWPRIYEDTVDAIPGGTCSDEILLYEAKWWNPLRDTIDFIMAPSCEV